MPANPLPTPDEFEATLHAALDCPDRTTALQLLATAAQAYRKAHNRSPTRQITGADLTALAERFKAGLINDGDIAWMLGEIERLRAGWGALPHA